MEKQWDSFRQGTGPFPEAMHIKKENGVSFLQLVSHLHQMIMLIYY